MVTTKQKIRVIVIDDDIPSRDNLKDFIERRHPDFEVVGEVGGVSNDGRGWDDDAWKLIEKGGFDVIFLDIQDEYNKNKEAGIKAGITLAEKIHRLLDKPPLIVIYTGYTYEHAMEIMTRCFAFSGIPKPIKEDEADRTFDKLRRKITATRQPTATRIEIRHYITKIYDIEERIEPISEFVVPKNDICYVKTVRGTDGDTLDFYLVDGRILKKVAGPLKTWKEKLEDFGFQKIRANILVNIDKVIRLYSDKGEGDFWYVELSCTKEKLDVGPTFIESLRQSLGILNKRSNR